ncbi:MAG: hypothetical protein FWE95_01975 [Planctomycetaceae bacterium]|nr:hypothetical protein [Planctomycetaceae bacterium]
MTNLTHGVCLVNPGSLCAAVGGKKKIPRAIASSKIGGCRPPGGNVGECRLGRRTTYRLSKCGVPHQSPGGRLTTLTN